MQGKTVYLNCPGLTLPGMADESQTLSSTVLLSPGAMAAAKVMLEDIATHSATIEELMSAFRPHGI